MQTYGIVNVQMKFFTKEMKQFRVSLTVEAILLQNPCKSFKMNTSKE